MQEEPEDEFAFLNLPQVHCNMAVVTPNRQCLLIVEGMNGLLIYDLYEKKKITHLQQQDGGGLVPLPHCNWQTITCSPDSRFIFVNNNYNSVIKIDVE